MNLEESIELLKSVRGNEYVATSDYESALGTVLAEIDRLKVKNEQLNYLVNQWFIGEPKEIGLREGLELMKKECKDCDKCANKKCPFYENCMPHEGIYYPKCWDIDNIIQAVEKLKEENNE